MSALTGMFVRGLGLLGPLLLLTGVADAAPEEASGAGSKAQPSVETLDAAGIPVVKGAGFTTRVKPRIIDVDLRRLPVRKAWQPGDPIRTIPRRRSTPAIVDPRPVNPVKPGDPLVGRQPPLPTARVGGFTTPQLNFEGLRSGSDPHDANGEVGRDYFVQAINDVGGTGYVFHDKTDGSSVAGPFTLSALSDGTGPCSTGAGDPIALYDEMARRWLLTEFSNTWNRLCVYVARTEDPINGGWYFYDFEAPNFPDYPKYAVWPDAYFVGTNEGESGLYAMQRDRMLQGQPASFQRFAVAAPEGFGFALLAPIDHDGIDLPPDGAAGLFIRQYDDESHRPANNDPSGDVLQLWELEIDWADSANSILTGPREIPIAEIDSDLCGLTSFECFPQPGTDITLDPLREVVMNLPKYRNFGGYEAVVGNLVTDVSGTDQGGLRWFELRRPPSGEWSLFQEGTFAPDIADGEGAAESRWMGASATDESGNFALAYSLSNAVNLFPGLRYTGRLASDPNGTMTAAETVLVEGTASQTSSERWGDYGSLSVDPVDGCTFWFTSNYGSSGSSPSASTRVASFRFDACGTPTFLLGADPLNQSACTASGAAALQPVTINVGSRNGFVAPVDLALDSLPAGFSGSISPQTVVPEGAAAASITLDAGSAGTFELVIEATAAGLDPRRVNLGVDAFNRVPLVPVLLSPANGADDVERRPVFDWQDDAQATSYRLQVATDAAFNDLLIDQVVAGSAFQPDFDLEAQATLYWRVLPENPCGTVPNVTVASFTTKPVPGQCASGASTIFYFNDDIEGGDNGWVHEAEVGPDTWARQTELSNSPATAWRADNVDQTSDQRLVSPAITLPAGADGPTLQYFARRGLEADGAVCYDGGLLEVSTDGGQQWTPIDGARLVTNPYSGAIDTRFGNPLGGLQAWCGV